MGERPEEAGERVAAFLSAHELALANTAVVFSRRLRFLDPEQSVEIARIESRLQRSREGSFSISQLIALEGESILLEGLSIVHHGTRAFLRSRISIPTSNGRS